MASFFLSTLHKIKVKKRETREKEEWELQLAVSALHDDFYRL